MFISYFTIPTKKIRLPNGWVCFSSLSMISFSVPDNLADLGMINVVSDVGGFIFDYLVTEKGVYYLMNSVK